MVQCHPPSYQVNYSNHVSIPQAHVSASPSVDPKLKLRVDDRRILTPNSVTKNRDGSITVNINNNQENSIAVGYVRKDGSYSTDQNSSTINSGNSKLLRITQSGTYDLQVTHKDQNTTDIVVKADPSLRAIKIRLGGKEYYLDMEAPLPQNSTQSGNSPGNNPVNGNQTTTGNPASSSTGTSQNQGNSTAQGADAAPGSATQSVDRDTRDRGSSQASPVQDGETAANNPAASRLDTSSAAPTVAVLLQQRAAQNLPRFKSELPKAGSPVAQSFDIDKISKEIDSIKNISTHRVQDIESINTRSSEVLKTLDAEIDRVSKQIGRPAAVVRFVTRAQNPIDADPNIVKNLKQLVELRDNCAVQLKGVVDSALARPEAEMQKAGNEIIKENGKNIRESLNRRIALEVDEGTKNQLINERNEFNKKYNTIRGMSPDRAWEGVSGPVKRLSNYLIDKAKNSKPYKWAGEKVSPLVQSVKDRVPYLRSYEARLERLVSNIDAEVNKGSLTEKQINKFTRQLERLERNLRMEEVKLARNGLSNTDTKARLEGYAKVRSEVLTVMDEHLRVQIEKNSDNQTLVDRLSKKRFVEHGDVIKDVLGDAGRKAFITEQQEFIEKNNPQVKSAREYLEYERKIPDNQNRINLAEQDHKIAIEEVKLEASRSSGDLAKVNAHEQNLKTLQAERVVKIDNLISEINEKLIGNSIPDPEKIKLVSERSVLHRELMEMKFSADPEIINHSKSITDSLNEAKNLREQAAKLFSDAESKGISPDEKKLKLDNAKQLMESACDADLKAHGEDVARQNRRLVMLESEKTTIKTLFDQADGNEKQSLRSSLNDVEKQINSQKQVISMLADQDKVLRYQLRVANQEVKISKLETDIKGASDKGVRANLSKELAEAKSELVKRQTLLELRSKNVTNKLMIRANLAVRQYAAQHSGKSIVAFAALDRAILADYSGQTSHSAVPHLITMISDGCIGWEWGRSLSVNSEFLVGAVGANLISGTGDGALAYGGFVSAQKGLSATAGRFAIAQRVAPHLSRGLFGVGAFAHGALNTYDPHSYMHENDAQLAWRSSSPILAGAGFGAMIGGPVGAGVGAGIGALGEGIGIWYAYETLDSKYIADDEKRGMIESLRRGLHGYRERDFVNTDFSRLSSAQREVISDSAKLYTLTFLMTGLDPFKVYHWESEGSFPNGKIGYTGDQAVAICNAIGLKHPTTNELSEEDQRKNFQKLNELWDKYQKSGTSGNQHLDMVFSKCTDECKAALLASREIKYTENGTFKIRDGLRELWKSNIDRILQSTDPYDTLESILPEFSSIYSEPDIEDVNGELISGPYKALLVTSFGNAVSEWARDKNGHLVDSKVESVITVLKQDETRFTEFIKYLEESLIQPEI